MARGRSGGHLHDGEDEARCDQPDGRVTVDARGGVREVTDGALAHRHSGNNSAHSHEDVAQVGIDSVLLVGRACDGMNLQIIHSDEPRRLLDSVLGTGNPGQPDNLRKGALVSARVPGGGQARAPLGL